MQDADGLKDEAILSTRAGTVSPVYQEIADHLEREGYIGVTPALVAQTHQQVQDGKPLQGILSRAIRDHLQERLGF